MSFTGSIVDGSRRGDVRPGLEMRLSAEKRYARGRCRGRTHGNPLETGNQLLGGSRQWLFYGSGFRTGETSSHAHFRSTL